MKICEEMKKLRAYLDTHGIGWRDQSGGNEAAWMCRTKFRYRGRSWSVINGIGSYGGQRTVGEENLGLLEAMPDNNNDPEGWLTAREVIARIESISEAGK